MLNTTTDLSKMTACKATCGASPFLHGVVVAVSVGLPANFLAACVMARAKIRTQGTSMYLLALQCVDSLGLVLGFLNYLNRAGFVKDHCLFANTCRWLWADDALDIMAAWILVAVFLKRLLLVVKVRVTSPRSGGWCQRSLAVLFLTTITLLSLSLPVGFFRPFTCGGQHARGLTEVSVYLVVGLVLPASFLIGTSWLMLRSLSRRRQKRMSASRHLHRMPSTRLLLRKGRKTTILVLTGVINFVLLRSPWSLLQLVGVIRGDVLSGCELWPNLYGAFLSLKLTNHAVNPFLYAFLAPSYQEELSGMFGRRSTCKDPREPTNVRPSKECLPVTYI